MAEVDCRLELHVMNILNSLVELETDNLGFSFDSFVELETDSFKAKAGVGSHPVLAGQNTQARQHTYG